MKFLLLLAVATAAYGQAIRQELLDRGCVADVAFVLDGSGSVKLENWRVMLNFVEQFASQLPLGVDKNRLGVVTFGNEASVEIGLDDFTDEASMQQAVRAIRYRDENTNTADGLRKLRLLFEQGPRENVPKIAIVLTDGLSTRESEFTLSEAKAVRESGINVFGIGIGEQLDITELKGIVANDERLLTLNEFVDLSLSSGLFDKVVESACAVTTTTPVVETTPSPLDPCYKKDIALVLDASGSIGEVNFLKMKTFVKNLLKNIPLSAAMNQLSIITYSTQSVIKMKLGEFPSHTELMDLIDNMPHINQRTNTSGAIHTLNTVVFGGEHDRADAENIAIVIHDTQSNTDEEFLVSEVATAKSRGIKIFSLGVGPEANLHELTILASDPIPYYLHIMKDFDDLLTKDARIESAVCVERYPREIGNKIQPLYLEGDVIITLDQSASLGLEKFNLQKEFVKNVATKLYNERVLISVAEMGRDLNMSVNFDDYESLSGLQYRIDAIRYAPQSVDLAVGLDKLKSKLGTEQRKLKLDDFLERTGISLAGASVRNAGDDTRNAGDDTRNAGDDTRNADDDTRNAGDDTRNAGDDTRGGKDATSRIPDPIYAYDIKERTGLDTKLHEGIDEGVDEGIDEGVDEVDVFNMPLYNRHTFPSVVMILTSGKDLVNMESLDAALASFNTPADYNDDTRNAGDDTRNADDDTRNADDDTRNADDDTRNAGDDTRNAGDDTRNAGDDTRSANHYPRSANNAPHTKIMLVAIGNDLPKPMLSLPSRKVDLMMKTVTQGHASLHTMVNETAVALAKLITLPLYHCEFETVVSGEIVPSPCNFEQLPSDDFDWSIHSGPTQSKKTGPESAYEGEYYAYIEASDRKLGDKATLLMTHKLDVWVESFACLNFYYSMNGWHTGRLEVIQVFEDGSEDIVWSRYGHVSKEWQYGLAQVRAYRHTKIGFRAVRGEAFSGDVALDAITMDVGVCPMKQQFPLPLKYVQKFGTGYYQL